MKDYTVPLKPMRIDKSALGTLGRKKDASKSQTKSVSHDQM
jgi:hypothetical protein